MASLTSLESLDLTPQRQEILLRYLAEINTDLRLWRDRNWSTLRDSLVAYLAIGGFSTFQPKAFGVLILALVVLAIASHVYLRKNLDRYNENVSARRNVERALGFHLAGVYLSKEPLVALEHLDERGGEWRGIPLFQVVSLIAALAVIAGLVINRYDCFPCHWPTAEQAAGALGRWSDE